MSLKSKSLKTEKMHARVKKKWRPVWHWR